MLPNPEVEASDAADDRVPGAKLPNRSIRGAPNIRTNSGGLPVGRGPGAKRPLVNKLLHEPTVRLREEAGSKTAEGYEAALRALFGLTNH